MKERKKRDRERPQNERPDAIGYRVNGSGWDIPYRLTEQVGPHYEDHDQRAREGGL